MASYRNLTHQLTAGIAETGESLTNMLQGLVESGDIEQAATIYSEVLELLAFEDAVGETVTGQQQTEGPLPEPGVDVTVTRKRQNRCQYSLRQQHRKLCRGRRPS